MKTWGKNEVAHWAQISTKAPYLTFSILLTTLISVKIVKRLA